MFVIVKVLSGMCVLDWKWNKMSHRMLQICRQVFREMFGHPKHFGGVYTPLTVFIRIINNLPLGPSVSMTV